MEDTLIKDAIAWDVNKLAVDNKELVKERELLIESLKDFCDLRTASTGDEFLKVYNKSKELLSNLKP